MASGSTVIIPPGQAANQAIDYINPTFYIGVAAFPVTTVIVGNGDTAVTPAAKTFRFTNGSGVDNPAGNATIVAPLSTGAATPARLIFQTGVAGVSGAAIQTATTGLTLSSTGTVPTASFAGNISLGAVLSNVLVRIRNTITGSGALALGIQNAGTMIASANNQSLQLYTSGYTLTPGAFTGLQVVGLNIGPISVAAFTSPADPLAVSIGQVNGTGATNGTCLQLTPPVGAGTNYAIAFTTVSTFNVLANGALTSGSTITAAGQITSSNGLIVASGSWNTTTSVAAGETRMQVYTVDTGTVQTVLTITNAAILTLLGLPAGRLLYVAA